MYELGLVLIKISIASILTLLSLENFYKCIENKVLKFKKLNTALCSWNCMRNKQGNFLKDACYKLKTCCHTFVVFSNILLNTCIS